jgi:hypothetical protein
MEKRNVNKGELLGRHFPPFGKRLREDARETGEGRVPTPRLNRMPMSPPP